MKTLPAARMAAPIALLIAASSCGQTPTPGPAGGTNEIAKALGSMQFGDAESIQATEDRLVHLGSAQVPALRQLLGDKQLELRRLEQSKDRALGQALKLQEEIGALDDALIRLTWKINPQELIGAFFAKAEAGKRPVLTEPLPLRILDDTLARLFPQHLFYPAIVRRYPLASVVAPPFKPQAMFVIAADGKLEYLTDPSSLEEYFRAHLKAGAAGAWPNTDAGRKDIVQAWLRLSEEFSQDGFFEFEIPPQQITSTDQEGQWKATGSALVVPRQGDRGEITVTMILRKDGTLGQVSETRNVHAGIRPKCQATKLLDKDEIVRAMAEQDILVMGKAAEPYLAERHSQANQELKSKLEELWRKILREN